MSDQPRIGVCVFDDPRTSAAGWASIHGSEAQRVSGHGDLQSDVLWVTNINFKAFREQQLIGVPHIRDTQYFRTSLILMAQEFGLEAYGQKLAEITSRIFAKVAAYGEASGISNERSGYRYIQLISEVKLPNHYRLQPEGPANRSIPLILNHSHQANQIGQGQRRPAGSKILPLTFPRGAFCRWLMTRPVPSSHRWKTLSLSKKSTRLGVRDGKEVRGTRSVLERLEGIGQKHAVLLRIRVDATAPQYRAFALFGAGASQPRYWASLPEVMYLARHSDVTIEEGVYTDIAPLDTAMADFDPDIQEYSYARGLWLENLWHGLAKPPGEQRDATALAVYLRAYDRIACAKAAEHMARYGFQIASYGSGRVMVAVRPAERHNLAMAAREIGLLPPLVDLESLPADQAPLSVPEDSELLALPQAGLPRGLAERLQSDFLLGISQMAPKGGLSARLLTQLDDVALLPEEERAPALEGVLEGIYQQTLSMEGSGGSSIDEVEGEVVL